MPAPSSSSTAANGAISARLPVWPESELDAGRLRPARPPDPGPLVRGFPLRRPGGEGAPPLPARAAAAARRHRAAPGLAARRCRDRSAMPSPSGGGSAICPADVTPEERAKEVVAGRLSGRPDRRHRHRRHGRVRRRCARASRCCAARSTPNSAAPMSAARCCSRRAPCSKPGRPPIPTSGSPALGGIVESPRSPASPSACLIGRSRASAWSASPPTAARSASPGSAISGSI